MASFEAPGHCNLGPAVRHSKQNAAARLPGGTDGRPRPAPDCSALVNRRRAGFRHALVAATPVRARPRPPARGWPLIAGYAEPTTACPCPRSREESRGATSGTMDALLSPSDRPHRTAALQPASMFHTCHGSWSCQRRANHVDLVSRSPRIIRGNTGAWYALRDLRPANRRPSCLGRRALISTRMHAHAW